MKELTEEEKEWERKLREKLEKELPDGLYQFDVGCGGKMMTGKGGAIEIEIQMKKAFLKDTSEDIEITDFGVKVENTPKQIKKLKKVRKRLTNITPPKKKRK
jgi:hypothetical protein